MNKLYVLNYNFNITLLGGQAFGWDYNPYTNEYIGITSSKIIKIKDLGEGNILWQTYPENNDYNFLSNYLGLNVDYLNILNQLPNDEYMNKAKEKYFGLRILNQDFNEALLAYICSSNKSVKGIRYSYRLLSKKFGKEIGVEGVKYNLFPDFNDIANASMEDILSTKVGFRGKYIKDTSIKILEGDLLNNIDKLDYEKAKSELMKFKGVGDKVADCVSVYSLGHRHVTPLDIWGKRFLTKYYGLDEKMKYEDMSKWATQYFNGYAGLGGQYLFEYIRSEGV